LEPWPVALYGVLELPLLQAMRHSVTLTVSGEVRPLASLVYSGRFWLSTTPLLPLASGSGSAAQLGGYAR
jgi:hypothetical protein